MVAYDYIIIGAGSAGCVLANRLSANPDNAVLLLESGKRDNSVFIKMPGGYGQLVPEKEYNWFYYTEPEPHLNGRKLFWPRGKVMGGSSSINAMIYIRGHARDYDQWRQMGNAGWAFNDVLPYFRRAENAERGKSKYRGVGGPVNVTQRHHEDPLTEAFLTAGEQAGYHRTDDFNGENQEGFAYYESTIKDAKRCSTAVAYIKPALKRKNLTVISGAHVTRILFEGTRANGVEFIRKGETEQVTTNREVILSGGAINSPQILMLSGIGPGDHLTEMNIPILKNLQGVGCNLQDHLNCGVQYEATQPVSMYKWRSPLRQTQVFFQWLLLRQGVGSSIPSALGAFIKSMPGLEVPDLQLHFVPILAAAHGFDFPAKHGFQCQVYMTRPKSRGNIKLKSANPMDHPRIFANYLSDADDLPALRRGVDITRSLLRQPAFDAFRGEEIWPGKHVVSDEALDEAIRDDAETLYHPVGTCKMGSDGMAVVDEKLRVHGIQDLRVVDASIMPTLISGNTNAPTIMIAEKASDMILGK